MSSNYLSHNGDANCSDGIQNEVKIKSWPALNKFKQKDETGLEKKMLEFKIKLKAEIDNIRENLVTSDSENQMTVMEYQNQCGEKTLHEIRQTEVTKLKNELLECKVQSKTIIDNLRKKSLTNELSNQRIVLECQRQYENLKEINNYSKAENLILQQKLETIKKSNSKLIKSKQKIYNKIRNIKEQLSNQLSLSNNEMQIANDLKKKRSRQEVIDLQEQPNNNKNALHQMKYKNCHCMPLMNELKNIRHDHQNMIIENNNLISKFTQELHVTKNNKISNNSNNFNDEILNLIKQLVECSKQNQLLNDVLQKLKSENEQLRDHVNASRDSNDNHCTNNSSKLEEDHQNSLKSLQKKKDIVEKSTEMLKLYSRVIAQMKKKEVIYENFRCKIQEELEKYSHDKSYVDERSDHNSETLRNSLEILLADTLCKLIRIENCVPTTLPIDLIGKDTPTSESSIEIHNNVHYNHLSSIENVLRQKNEEMMKLRNQIDEYSKQIDELKHLYVKECSEKEQSLNEKEKLEKRLDALSAQFKTLNDEFGNLVKEKEELKIILIGIKKETMTNQTHK